jgi:hypothetical protein
MVAHVLPTRGEVLTYGSVGEDHIDCDVIRPLPNIITRLEE